MNLLVSTESRNLFSLAIGTAKIEQTRVVRKEYQHSELLLRETDHIVNGKKIDNIFVVQGPGAFSSLRIGLAVANALAYGLGCQIIGIELKVDWHELGEQARLEKIWQSGVQRLKKKKGNKLRFIEPTYGREPHITVKKKTTGGQHE